MWLLSKMSGSLRPEVRNQTSGGWVLSAWTTGALYSAQASRFTTFPSGTGVTLHNDRHGASCRNNKSTIRRTLPAAGADYYAAPVDSAPDSLPSSPMSMLFNEPTLTILESITEPFVFLDRDLRYVYANESALRLLRKERAEIEGKYVWDVFPHQPGSLFRAPVDRALETGEVTHVVGLNQGRGIWFDCHNYPSEHGVAILFRDVSEQHRVEDLNRHAEEQLAFLAEASHVLGSSLDYQETLRHIANLMVPQLADWCAIDVYDEDGRLKRVTVAHRDPERVRQVQELVASIPSDPDKPHTLAHVARTGQSILVPEVTEDMLKENASSAEHLEALRSYALRSLIAVPLKIRGANIGAIMMVWSDTDRTYKESDLRFAEELATRAAMAIENAMLYREARTSADTLQAFNETLEERVRERTQALDRAVKKLEERNRELQDFAYVASHDLQEPLRKISTFSELVVEEYGSVVDEEGRYYLNRIQDASRRMALLIKDLLSYSRISSRAEPFQRIDLNEIVATVAFDVDMALRDADGRVEFDPLPVVEADPTQMRQLFQNLIVNAMKFRKPDEPPMVQIHGRIVESDAADAMPERHCLIEVADNGIGFDARHAARIFLPFKRLNNRSEYPGTGVGLAICKRIVDRHNGTIEAESTLGAGSTFRIRLPIAQPDPE